jgi:hypothetical protein
MAGMRILLTGCGRSGTSYTATLLTALDVRCGHELVFRLPEIVRGEVSWPEDLPAESSWLAAPYLQLLPAETLVLHQVREPLAVLRSLRRVGLFETSGPFRSFVAEHLGQELEAAAPLEAGLLYWDRWNGLVEQRARDAGLPYQRHRLEDLDPVTLAGLLAQAGHYRSPAEIEERQRRVRSDRNTRGDKSTDGTLTWASLPDSAAKQAVAERARTYGYALEG